jgi:hypothetical protein
MAVEKTTKTSTEADLEAKIHGALRLAFPWIPDGSIQHQTTFTFSFGKQTITVDGANGYIARSRADILLNWGDQPLAVLELKREGLALNSADDEQGLSYSRVLHPRPPLVVISNGENVRLLETHTGEEWQPDSFSQEAFAKLIRSANRVATNDLNVAINTLMGTDSAIWVQAVRQTSQQNFAELFGSWDESLQPFVPEFLIPREATQVVLSELRGSKKPILIAGPPLIGKSNVLRELLEETKDADDLVTFFIEADTGTGIFSQLSDTLSQALNWPVTSEEVRAWLLRISKSSGPTLVLMIDGIGSHWEDLRRDIEDLTSQAFGSAVCIVLALDDTIADRIVLDSAGRKATAIGRRAVRVSIGPLNNQEFVLACKCLRDIRIEFMRGGDTSVEFRLPWILRALSSDVVSAPNYANEQVVALIPPLLGLELIDFARRRFDDNELQRLFRATAQAVIEDSQDQERAISLILESIAIFVVRRQTLQGHLERTEINHLIEHGYLRAIRHDSGADILVIRVPELLASEAAGLLASELAEFAKRDAKEAANWLSDLASRLPLGNIVATQSLLDAGKRYGTLPITLITGLINSPPKPMIVQPGTKAAIHFQGSGTMNMTFKEEGVIEVEVAGQHHVLDMDPGDEIHTMYSDVHSWLILSYLSSYQFALEDENGNQSRIDPTILLKVGACQMVLRTSCGGPEMNGILTHDIPGEGSIVCYEAGIVEPITLSILRFLDQDCELAEHWLEEAVRQKSLPLLARIDIALRQLSGSASASKAEFSHRVLKDLVQPAFLSLPGLH